jgi:hypothetical protein
MRANLGIDFSQVKGFVLAPSSAHAGHMLVGRQGTGTTPPNDLFALNADGSLTVVSVVEDGDGGSSTSTSTAHPLAIYDTVKYTLFRYENVRFQGNACMTVAARKSDAALFCINAWVDENSPDGIYFNAADSDAGGDQVYLFNGRDGIFQLDFANTPATLSTIFDGKTDGKPVAMAVNADGDLLLSFMTSDSGPKQARLYKAAGGQVNVSGTEIGCLTEGLDGDAANFYYTAANPNATAKVQKRTKATDFAETTYYDDSAGTIGIPGCFGANVMVKRNGIIYVTKKATVSGGPFNYFVELVNGATPIRHDVPGVQSLKGIFGYDGGLVLHATYANGDDSLIRFEVPSLNQTTILAPGAYSITKVGVSPSGEVTFGGRDLSNNARILGNIAAGTSTVTVVPQDFAGDVQQIQRIN